MKQYMVRVLDLKERGYNMYIEARTRTEAEFMALQRLPLGHIVASVEPVELH